MSTPQFSDSGQATCTLEKKRARDRRSQQAMRDRVKTQLDNLTSQVDTLKCRLGKEAENVAQLQEQVQALESENEYFVMLNTMLQESVPVESRSYDIPASTTLAAWQVPPRNIPASNLVDTILQGVLDSRRKALDAAAKGPRSANQIRATAQNPYRPNFCAMSDKQVRAKDDFCNVVGDVLQSYKEIALPEKVGKAYLMTGLLLWRAQLDEYSWNRMPVWLRPTPTQLDVPHAAWIDQIPWPGMRDWLIAHPDIALPEFAFTYNSSLHVSWNMDPSHVLVALNDTNDLMIVNPVFEQHIRQLKNWNVGEKFRTRYPELGLLVKESHLNN